jgi:hypothetical protein
MIPGYMEMANSRLLALISAFTDACPLCSQFPDFLTFRSRPIRSIVKAVFLLSHIYKVRLFLSAQLFQPVTFPGPFVQNFVARPRTSARCRSGRQAGKGIMAKNALVLL